MAYDLHKFGLQDMIEAGRRLRRPDACLDSMEKAAASVVDFFYENLRSRENFGSLSQSVPNCVLARCFKTHPFEDLPPNLQRKAASLLKKAGPPEPGLQCLTLLATRGELPEWNSRHASSSHQVIPLPTVEMVLRAPMVSQLFLQLGMRLEQVVELSINPVGPAPSFNVFHVESALGSKMIPEQDQFVLRHGIKSVLGFGGLLPAGELFAVILFTRVTITAETAALFRTLALGVKLTLLPFSGGRVFAES